MVVITSVQFDLQSKPLVKTLSYQLGPGAHWPTGNRLTATNRGPVLVSVAWQKLSSEVAEYSLVLTIDFHITAVLLFFFFSDDFRLTAPLAFHRRFDWA